MTTVTGYHGTTKEVAADVVAGTMQLRHSINIGDWLGRGAYFWQDAPYRALLWAKFRNKGLPIEVLTADIDLQDCLDLFDAVAHKELRRAYPRFLQAEKEIGIVSSQDELFVTNGKVMTKNDTTPIVERSDPYITYRDRAFIDWYVQEQKKKGSPIASIRGIFLVGKSLYQESFLFNWANAQITVLDGARISNIRLWSA